MRVLKLAGSEEFSTFTHTDQDNQHDNYRQQDAESLAQEIRTLKEEMRWAREYGPRLVDALKDSTDRLAQVQERLATHDSALTELFDRGRQEVLIRQSYERYLPPHLIQELAANPGRVNLGGEVRRVTILFADFRGFSATVSHMNPQDVIRVLNSYFTQIAETIYRYGGSIDKFMGDGFMAIFGAPAALEDDALRAVRAGLEIQKFLAISGKGEAEPSGFRLPMG
ncbi:MAG: Adenylate cyclase, family 3 (some protein containing domain), partial [Dehalococcoidia bacterium]|nr:Adenylate cyclase, family 3 (some protein containing domain) [Dehalococcoidia bacterium]